jgi:hypothetical protein
MAGQGGGGVMRDTLQGMAALHCRLAQMDGHKMDKSSMRFSAMADYMEHVAACGAVDPLSALSEAVETAIVGSPMYIPGHAFDRAPWRWMEHQPRPPAPKPQGPALPNWKAS